MIFPGEDKRINEEVLNYIPQMVTHDQNNTLQTMLYLDELKHVVLSMGPHSTVGLDGMNGKFFQACWSIIKHDFFVVVQAFFYGLTMPKYFSHTCLVLLPKTSNLSKFLSSNK